MIFSQYTEICEVEKALRETFLPALFEVLGEQAPELGFTHLPVKQAVLALPYPILKSPENWTAYCVITGHLVAALRVQVEFRTADHSACLREGRMAVWRRSAQQEGEALAATISGDPVQGARQLKQGTNTGSWLIVQKSRVNRTELGAQEWRDALFLRYRLESPDLPKYCDGCNGIFTIFRALDCKRGGLFAASHKELGYRVSDLAVKAFTPSHVRNDPLIFTDCVVKRPKANPAGTRVQTDQDGAPPP